MSSYHTSFNYLDQNSAKDHHLLIAAFEPDNGPMDSFLNMEQVYTESSDGTKRNLYGLKYNTVAAVKITLVKPDGSDFSVAENRKILKWLTGNRQASWLDLYEGETLAYSFWGSITTVQQQKLDARVVGIILTFESTTPWAYSAPQDYDCRFGEANLVFGQEVLEDGTKNNFIYKGLDSSVENAKLGIDEDGVLYNDDDDVNATFNIDTDGVIYNGEDIRLEIDNQSDDLYSYINLDMTYENLTGNETDGTLTIENETLGETTRISGIKQNEIITISKGQFITSETFPNRIFGKNFNFVWPRLQPGINEFKINGSGRGVVKFTCRYPIKIGDCAVDINNLINTSICADYTPSDPSNPGSGGNTPVINTSSAVLYTEQNLTKSQKEQARKNIGAGTSSFSGSYEDLTNKPNLFSGSYNDLTDIPIVDSILSNTSINAVQNKVIYNALNNKSDTSHTHNVSDIEGVIPSSEKGIAGGVASLDNDGKVPSDQLPSMDYIPTSKKGTANGVASLDSNGKVPSSQLNLSNSVSSTSTTTVANSAAVKTAYDKATTTEAITANKSAKCSSATVTVNSIKASLAGQIVFVLGRLTIKPTTASTGYYIYFPELPQACSSSIGIVIYNPDIPYSEFPYYRSVGDFTVNSNYRPGMRISVNSTSDITIGNSYTLLFTMIYSV